MSSIFNRVLCILLLILSSCGLQEKKNAYSVSFVHVIPNSDISTEVLEYRSSIGKSTKILIKDSVLNNCLRNDIEKVLKTDFFDVYSTDLTFDTKAVIISDLNSSKYVSYGGFMKGDSLLLFEAKNIISNKIRFDRDNRIIYFRIVNIDNNDTLNVESIRISFDVLEPIMIGRDDGYTK